MAIHVTLRQLEVFTAAAETLSFVRVAERLRLTPSAISFQIRQIEGQTGLVLFERIGRRVALTEAGRVLLRFARPVLLSMGAVDQAVQALRGSGGGRARVGLVSTAKYIVPHIVAAFRTQHPGVTVQLREGNRAAILGLMHSGEIELAVMGQPPDDADVQAVRFAAHPSVIIGPPGYGPPVYGMLDGALAGGDEAARLRPEDLAGEWFIVREIGSGTRMLSDRFFAAAGFSPRIAMETSSNEMIKQAVMAGMGLALLSLHTVALERSLGLLRVLAVEGFPVQRSWYVVQRRTAPLLPDQAALRQFLLDHGAAVIERQSGRPAALP